MADSAESLALRLAARGHFAENAVVPAREAYERLLATRPGDPEALLGLARLSRALGDLDAGDRYLAAGLAAAPDDGDVRYECGRSRWQAGDDAGAVAHLERVRQVAPAHLGVAGMLATSYAALGHMQLVEGAWADALRAGAPWTPAALAAGVREALVDPAAYAGLFRAAAAVAGGPAAEALARRAHDRVPRLHPALPEPWRTLLALPEPRRLSACMIVKDEAPNLRRALAALDGVVDELVVVDTGSTDETVAIAEAHGAIVGRFAWVDDFAAARNASLALATGDWLMIYDADHAVDGRCKRLFRTWLQTLHHDAASPGLQVFAPQIVEHTDAPAGRAARRSYMAMLFPRDPDVRYAGVLHEQVEDFRAVPRPVEGRIVPDLVMHHYGYTAANLAHHDKHGRNMRILRADLVRRPDHPFVHYNLGLQHHLAQDAAGADAHLRTSLALAEARGEGYKPPFLESAYIMHAGALLRGAALAEAGDTCERGLRCFPESADLLGMLGYVRLSQRRGDDAIPLLEAAIRRRGLLGAHAGDPKFAGWFAELLLGFASWKLGDAGRADRHLSAAWELAPDRDEAARTLVRLGQQLFGSLRTGPALMQRVGVAIAVGAASL